MHEKVFLDPEIETHRLTRGLRGPELLQGRKMVAASAASGGSGRGGGGALLQRYGCSGGGGALLGSARP